MVLAYQALLADPTGAISGFPGKCSSSSLQVGDAPSHRDLQCVYILTEGHHRALVQRRVTVWTFLCKEDQGETRMGKCHVHCSRDSLCASWPPVCSFCFQKIQTSLVLLWSPAHATTMFTFYHPVCIVHPALGLIFREFLTRNQHQHPEGSAFTMKAFSFNQSNLFTYSISCNYWHHSEEKSCVKFLFLLIKNVWGTLIHCYYFARCFFCECFIWFDLSRETARQLSPLHPRQVSGLSRDKRTRGAWWQIIAKVEI